MTAGSEFSHLTRDSSPVSELIKESESEMSNWPHRSSISFMLVFLVLSGVALTGCSKSSRVARPSFSQTNNSPEPSTVQTVEVKLPNRPLDVAVDEQAVWVSTLGENSGKLFQIDPRSNSIASETSVGFFPRSIAVTGGSIWVANNPGDGSNRQGIQNRVFRVESVTNKISATIDVDAPEDVIVGEGSVWVANSGGNVFRVDVSRNEIVARITIGGRGAVSLASGSGSIWSVASGEGSSSEISRIDPLTNTVAASISIDGGGPFGKIASTGHSIWVTKPVVRPGIGEVVQIDPTTNRIVGEPIEIPSPADVAVDGKSIWFSSSQGTIVRLEPTSRRLIGDPITVGQSADALAANSSDVWVIDYLSESLIRVNL